MPRGVPKSSSSFKGAVRDFAGVGTPVILAILTGQAGIPELGALIGSFLAPKVAKSQASANFTQNEGYLLIWDSVFSRFGREAV